MTGSCRTNVSWPQAPLPQPEPAERTGAGTNPLRHQPPAAMPQHAAFPVVIQSFCITPILAFFNSFWGLSRHLSRLDKPQKLFHDNEGSGDAEAVSVPRNPTATTKPTHHPDRLCRNSWLTGY